MRQGARAAAGLLLLLLVSCGPESTVYSVRGQVVRVENGGKSLVIDHETIPGWMEAMQMSLPVADSSLGSGLSPGDKIRFDLHVAGERVAIGAIETLPETTELELAGSEPQGG